MLGVNGINIALEYCSFSTYTIRPTAIWSATLLPLTAQSNEKLCRAVEDVGYGLRAILPGRENR